jgi:hypothetical protein
MVKPLKLYQPGDKCPATGVYSVIHDEDCHGPTEILMSKDRDFPGCPTCVVQYAILHLAPFPSEDPDFSS